VHKVVAWFRILPHQLIQVPVRLIHIQAKLDALSHRYAIFYKLSAQGYNIVVLLVRHRVVHEMHLDRYLVTAVMRIWVAMSCRRRLCLFDYRQFYGVLS
jgi:hypothetical protein